jgi:hypothetical protein
MLSKLFVQLSLLFIITGIIAAILHTFGINYILGIIAGIIIQYGIYNIFIYTLETYTILKAKKLENERIKELSYQVVEVVCPCLQKTKEIVPLRLNEPTVYKCNTCSKQVRVFVQTETVLVTEPIADTSLNGIDELIKSKINEST